MNDFFSCTLFGGERGWMVIIKNLTGENWEVVVRGRVVKKVSLVPLFRTCLGSFVSLFMRYHASDSWVDRVSSNLLYYY